VNKFWDLIRIFPYSASRIFPLWGQEQVGPFIFVHTVFFHISFTHVYRCGFSLYLCCFPLCRFGGRPIYAELTPVTDFREACCRQYETGECTRYYIFMYGISFLFCRPCQPRKLAWSSDSCVWSGAGSGMR
jgi:hypothetical protein